MEAFTLALHQLLFCFVRLLPGFCDKFVNFSTNFANTHKKSNSKTMCWLGWPGGEVEVTKKKIQIIFLPLMVQGNESPKEF